MCIINARRQLSDSQWYHSNPSGRKHFGQLDNFVSKNDVATLSIFALLLHSLVCFSFSDAPACLPGDNRVCACVCGIGVGGSWFIVLRGRKPIISNFAILSVISLHQPGFDVWEPGHCIPRIHNNYIGFLRLPKEFVF